MLYSYRKARQKNVKKITRFTSELFQMAANLQRNVQYFLLNNLCVSGPGQFKPKLFNGQLYFKAPRKNL